jgi:O-antigen ligase
MWAAATQAIREHPWFGTGLGTFRDVYPLYADKFVPYIVDRVHSDYLELALGLGVPAASLWVLAIAWLLLRCVAGIARRRRRRIYAIAAVGATVLIGLHSLVDFSLQMPAVAVLFAAILGVGLAQAFPKGDGWSRSAEKQSHVA